jgi:membrane protein required for colicin V production
VNWLDIVIIVALAATIFFGLKTGIIKAGLSLAGIIVGVLLAGYFYVPLSEQLSFIPLASLAKVIAFIIILAVVAVTAAVLAQLLKWVASIAMLGWIDRLGGAIFGLLLGVLFCSALLAVWVKFLGVGDTILESSLARVLVARLPMVLALLPDEFDAVRSFFY